MVSFASAAFRHHLCREDAKIVIPLADVFPEYRHALIVNRAEPFLRVAEQPQVSLLEHPAQGGAVFMAHEEADGQIGKGDEQGDERHPARAQGENGETGGLDDEQGGAADDAGHGDHLARDERADPRADRGGDGVVEQGVDGVSNRFLEVLVVEAQEDGGIETGRNRHAGEADDGRERVEEVRRSQAEPLDDARGDERLDEQGEGASDGGEIPEERGELRAVGKDFAEYEAVLEILKTPENHHDEAEQGERADVSVRPHEREISAF